MSSISRNTVRGIVCAIGIASLAGAAAGSITVDPRGNGSTDVQPTYDGSDPWNIPGDLSLGHAGPGELRIDAGSVVSDQHGYIALTQPGWLTVDGPGSRWINTGTLYAGKNGCCGDLTVQNGGQVTSVGGYLAQDAGAQARVTIDGPDSRWDVSGQLRIGSHDDQAWLTVRGGGQLVSESAYSRRASIVVDGPDSRWTSTSLSVQSGTGLTVQKGGHIHVTEQMGIITGLVTVTGPGSSMDVGGTLSVAGEGTTTLLILNGASVTSQYGGIGASGAYVPGIVTVAGAGSQLTIDRDLFLPGGSSALNVQAGGSVTTQELWMEDGAFEINLDGGTLTVGLAEMTKGAFNWTSGTFAFTGNLAITTPGPFRLADPAITPGRTLAVGDTLTVAAPGALVLGGGRVEVGALNNTGGTFDWTGGVLRFTGDLAIGVANPFGLADPAIFAGRTLEAGGLLSLAAGGSLGLSGGAVRAGAFDNSAGGAVNWTAGGTLTVDGEATIGQLTVPAAGTLNLAGPALVVDSLDNSAGGTVNFTGGTLEVRGTLRGVDQLAGPEAVTLSGAAADWRVSQLTAGADVQVTVDGGMLSVAGGGFANFSSALAFGPGGGAVHLDGGMLIHAASVLQLPAGATLGGHGTVYASVDLAGGAIAGDGDPLKLYGDLSGSGAVSGCTVYGEIGPGLSLGVLTFENVTLGGGTVVNMEIAARGPGGCDRIVFVGAAALAESLNVLLAEGFVPEKGDVFDLFDWGSAAGRFTGVDVPDLPGGLTWDTSALYDSGEISVVPEPCLAVLLTAAAPLLLRRRRNSRTPAKAQGGVGSR